MNETILERYLKKQKEREKTLLGENKLSFSYVLNVKPEYLFLALTEGKEFYLSPGKNDYVIHQFGDLETILIDADKEELKKLTNSKLALNFLYCRANPLQGFLLSLGVTLKEGEDNLFVLKKNKEPALTNEILIRKIKEAKGIDLNNKKGSVDYLEYKKYVEEQLASSSLEFYNCNPYLTSDTMHDYFLWREISEESQPLRRLDSSTPAYDVGYQVNKFPILSMRRAFEKLDNEDVVFVTTKNKKLKNIFLTFFFKDKLSDKKTILLGASNKDEVSIKKKNIEQTTYKSIMPSHFFQEAGYNLLDEAKKVMTTKDPSLSEIGSVFKKNWNTALADYIRNDHSEGSALLKTGEDWLTGVNKFSYYHNLRNISIPLDVENYKSEDFEKDEQFMRFFKKAIYVNKGVLRKNPLYSLRAIGENEKFLAMRNALNKTWTDVDNLQSKLEFAHGKDWGFGKIYSIETLNESLRKLKVILGYDGFSPFFFNLIDDAKAMPLALTLSSLKERKDRLFEQICEYVSDLSKLDEPLNLYLDQFKGKSFKERRKGKKSLLKVLRDKRDFNDFVDTLSKYQEILEDYNTKTKDAEKLFGLILYSEEGPKKALEALQFLGEYRKLIKEDQRCDKEKNPFVLKIFDDYVFREEERAMVKQIDLLLLSIKEDFANLKDIFTEPFHENTLSFSSLKQDLKAKEEVSYEEYLDYSNLQRWIDRSSSTLKEALTTFDAVNEPLANFENDYWYSLYKAFALEREKKGVYSPLKASMALCCYEPYIVDEYGITVFQKIKKETLDYWSSRHETKQIQEAYRYGGVLLPYRVLDYFSDFAKVVSPLQICCGETVPLSKIKFDYVLIENPQEYSTDQLALLLSRGTKALILSDSFDERFKGYGEEVFDDDSLYRYGLHFENLSREFIDLLAFGFEENGYELLNEEESHSSMPLSYRDDNGVLHPVIPDCLIGANASLNIKIILNALLIYLGKEPIVCVSSMMLLTNPKKAVAEAIKNAKIN